MSLDALDQRLSAWAERLRHIDDNLLALEADPTYQLLTGRGGKRTPLEGASAARVTPALDALADLFDARGKLTDVLERARSIRDSISTVAFWEHDEKIRQIGLLLEGPSIQLGAQITPLAQRTLLDAGSREVAIVPEQLVVAMAQAFERARDAVLAVAIAWNTLEPSITKIETELKELRRTAEAIGEKAAASELGPLEREVVDLHSRVARDPLGVFGNVQQSMLPRIADARAKIEILVLTRDRAREILARAKELRHTLDATHPKAIASLKESRREITPIPDLGEIVAEALMSGLDEWRMKLEATLDAGRFGPAEIGAKRYAETIEAYLAQDQSIITAYEALIARRSELVGRLSARRAQLMAVSTRGVAVDPKVTDRGREADALLRARPTDLSAAIAAVEAFEKHVIDLTRSRKQSG